MDKSVMDSTTSLSKGCFTFLPSKSSKHKKKVVNDFAPICSQSWYRIYRKVWNDLKEKIEVLNEEICLNLINDVVQCVKNLEHKTDIIETIALFTGINMSDHDELFDTLCITLRKNSGYRVCMLPRYNSTDSVKTLVENMICTFVESDVSETHLSISDDELSSDEVSPSKKFKRSDYTLRTFVNWYSQQSQLLKCVNDVEITKPLIIVIRDVETYQSTVIDGFLRILISVADSIPLILVLGVATSLSVLNRIMSQHVFSKLEIHLFQSQPSVTFLNKVLENVFLTPQCPFVLGPKVLQYLTDIFLSYNFSITNFVKGIQFSLMDHLYCFDYAELCSGLDNSTEAVNNLTEIQLKALCDFPSMKMYISCQKRSKSTFLDSTTLLKKEIYRLLVDLYRNVARFHTGARCLHALVSTLPQSTFGKHVREIYVQAVSSSVVETVKFKTCFGLLSCMSKDELVDKLDSVIDIFRGKNEDDELLKKMKKKLLCYKDQLKDANLDKPVVSSDSQQLDIRATSRSQLRQKLLQNAQQDKLRNQYEILRTQLLEHMKSEVFAVLLRPLTSVPLYELLMYDDVSTLRSHINPVPRRAFHKALKDPALHLQCECCQVPEKDAILKTMPDICIAYKLHLECGTLINLYDWLQSFVAVIDSKDGNQENGDDEIDPKLQARFSQAVAELQFLGFLRPTKRKLDHVERLTFDGN